VVVQFGMNDCNSWSSEKAFPRVFQETFAANLREILMRLHRCNVETMFVCTNHPSTKKEYGVQNEMYNNTIRFVCRDRGVSMIDVETSIKTSCLYDKNLSEHVLSDGVHLSEYGHLLYLNVIKPYLNKVIDKLLKETL